MPKLLKLPKWLRVPSPVDLGRAKHNALPMHGIGNPNNSYTWEEWREEVQTKHPVRYFFFETIPLWFSVKIKMPIQEAIYWTKCKLFKKYKFHLIDIRNTNYKHDSLGKYTYGYVDPLNKILYASFAILSKHVETADSGPKFQIQWLKEELAKNDNEIHGSRAALEKKIADYQTILDLYEWWNVTRPILLKKCDDALISDSKKSNKDVLEKYKDSNAADEQLEKEECDALKRLADIRMYLWN